MRKNKAIKRLNELSVTLLTKTEKLSLFFQIKDYINTTKRKTLKGMLVDVDNDIFMIINSCTAETVF